MRLTRPFFSLAAVISSLVSAGCGGGGGEGPSPVGPPASVSALSGSSASVTAGATSPLALVAKVQDAGGHAVPGATVTWGTASGSITPATATTDGSGQTSAQWTPGKTAGAQTATASVTGAGSATFTATVTAGPLAKIKLTPDTTKLGAAGTTAQLSASGLDAFDNAISGFAPTYTIDDPTIATVSGTGLLTSVKTGTTAVHATSGSITASAIVVVNTVAPDPCAGVTMTLGVGQSQTLTGTAAGQFCVTGATGAEFVAIPFFATGNGGTGSGQTTYTPAPNVSFSVTPINNISVSGPPTPSVLSGLQPRASVFLGTASLVRDAAWESRFRERVRNELGPRMRAVRRTNQRSSGARLSLGVAADVAVNDQLQLNVNVLGGGCSATPTLVSATVHAVSKHAIVAEDNSDAGGFSDADYQAFADQFDNQVWIVDSTNFGAPTDIDQNGRIILFFTKAVNALTQKSPSSTSFVGGFFYGRDEFYQKDATTHPQGGDCPGSNQAEMFYLLAPDPQGVSSNPRPVSFVKSITIGTVAHEFQHLINFGRHLWINPVVFDNFEETFLDEGLAHVAEELNYYAATGRSPRTNIVASDLITPSDSYLAFGNQNAVRFREYLKNPDKYPPYSVLADTSLAVRGGIWSLLRYATDQRASSVPEKKTWFDLVNPSVLSPTDSRGVTGVENLQAVFGSDFVTRIMREWAIANYMDDVPATSSVAAYQHLSWNTRSVETYVNGSNQQDGTTYPLKVRNLVSFQAPISLADGGAAYLRFGVDAGKVGGGTLNVSSALPSSFSITVIRTK